jgi:hypothetical protein
LKDLEHDLELVEVFANEFHDGNESNDIFYEPPRIRMLSLCLKINTVQS